MTKRQFSFLLGLVSQSGCIIYEDNIRRPTSDAAGDVAREMHDTGPVGREATSDAPLVDVAVVDAEASSDVHIDVDGGADATSVFDASDVPALDAGDASDAASDQFVDVVVPPEAAPDVRGDGFDVDASDSNVDTVVDPPVDPPIVGCTVDFTVSGVTWDTDRAAEDGGARTVRLVGDIGTLGAWSPASGIAMTEKAPGAWSMTIWLTDRLTIEFKFVKLDGALPPEWEAWLPLDSNRSLRVDCGADGGPIWVDAATDAGPANRAVGRSYGGAFGMRPLDATK
jgi:hypothetical protein